QLFLAWTSFPERQAQISKYSTYGPINIKSISVLDRPEFDQMRDDLPSSGANIQFGFLRDEVYYGEIADAMAERFQEFLQE
ncbi:MAG: hypothetical protein V3U79_11925, partial [Dehalococcoidia bacterium]